MYDADKTSQKISDLEREYRKSQQKKGAESLIELKAQVRAKLKRQAEADDNIYDPRRGIPVRILPDPDTQEE